MGKEIELNEIIKLLDETINTAQNALNQSNSRYEQSVKAIEAQWREMIKFSSEDDLSSPLHWIRNDYDEDMYKELLRLHIESLRLYRAKLADEHNKRQMDYRLEWQKNRLAIITAIIGAIGVAIGTGITLILKQ